MFACIAFKKDVLSFKAICLLTQEYSVPTTSEDEYNELHFEDDRTGQEDQSDTYHHLQIT